MSFSLGALSKAEGEMIGEISKAQSWEIRHSLAKQHKHFYQRLPTSTPLVLMRDLQSQINCSVIIECSVANSMVHSVASLDHGKIILKWQRRDDTQHGQQVCGAHGYS